MKKKKTGKAAVYTGLSLVIWIIVWQAAAVIINKPIFLPTAFSAAKSLAALLGTPAFIKSVSYSLGHILAGFLLGCVIGIALSATAHVNAFLRSFIGLPVKVVKATPVASFTILALLWMTSQKLSILISCLMVVPVIYTNMLAGLENMDRNLLVMAKDFRVRNIRKIRYIYLPELLPYISSACATAIGLAWKSGVAAEVIGNARNSIGNNLYQAKIYMEIPELFAWTFVTVAISILTEWLIKWLLILARAGILGRGDERKSRKNQPLAASFDFGAMDGFEDCEGRKRAAAFGCELLHVSKAFDEKQVISDFSAEFNSGTAYALLGASGIGKTTVLNLIAGHCLPDAGRIIRKGEGNSDGAHDGYTAAPEIAFVYQENRLVESLSAYRNVLLVCRTKEQKERIPAVLAALGLENDVFTGVSELSGGMKRRVAIARALVSEYPVLLLDEPFTGLDECTKADAARLISELSKNKMLLLVTHDEREAEALGCRKTIQFGNRE